MAILPRFDYSMYMRACLAIDQKLDKMLPSIPSLFLVKYDMISY